MISTGRTRVGAGPSWTVLWAGASAQVALESIATASGPARVLAVFLVLAVLVTNAATAWARGNRFPHRLHFPVLALLLAAGSVLWFVHGCSALRAYSEDSMPAAALPPLLVVIGTAMLQTSVSGR